METVAQTPSKRSERSEFEGKLREAIRENLDDLNKLSWLVGSGDEASSKKISHVVKMLEDALNNKRKDADNRLVKTMRVARNAILHIYEAVEHREGACFMACACVFAGGEHSPWPLYAAGCHSEESDENTRIGGRLWDVANLLRMNNGYVNPRPVALSVVYALKRLASELALKESCLQDVVKKISRSPF